MYCSCRSKELYANSPHSSFSIDGAEIPVSRKINHHPITQAQVQLLSSIYQNSKIFLPTHIEKITMEEVYASPLWFYKKFISSNKPCIITDAINGDILDTWANPSQFKEITQQMDPISISLTPDGFADSIKNQYFIEPFQIKGKIQDLIDWKQQSKQMKLINPKLIPYVQHQNSNLTKQCSFLAKFIDEDVKNFLSLHFFEGNDPDAQNFWMGYQDSVSSLHKDPYENFYTTIVGEKHFSLLPPISIIYLHQQSYKNARYKFDHNNLLSAFKTTNEGYQTTKWISCNPDLDSDQALFPQLSNLFEYQHHVIVEAGETLFLPSLWYHQVSQTHKHSPYTIAVNYWFDMSFGPGYTLYQSARKIKGY